MNKESYYEEIDILKGIGIILIVLGHLEPGKYLMSFLYTFHLFLFFMCSGFLGARYKTRKSKDVIKRNIMRLLIPYFIWNIISNLLNVLIGEIVISQAIRNLLFLDMNVGWNAALWFLPCLFWTDIICSFIIRIESLRVQCVFGIVFLFLWYIFAKYQVSLPLGIYTVPPAATFWLLGYWAKRLNAFERLNKLTKAKKLLGGSTALLLTIVGGCIYNSVISIYHVKYNNVMITVFAGISGVIFISLLASFISSNRIKSIVRFYGKNTLAILCTHYFVLRVIGEIGIKILGINLWRYTSSIKSIVICIIVIGIYYPILIGINKLKIKCKWLVWLL